MSDIVSKEVCLKQRPVGMPTLDDFEITETSIAAPQSGEVRVRNLWMSVDPYMRGRMTDRKSYVPPFETGAAMQGGAIGEVIDSENSDFAPGDLVNSMMGWRQYFVSDPALAMIQKLPETPLPPQAFLGVVGMPGLTAYGGLLRAGEPKAGETVFVSGAAGAVGSYVCQIAKIKGCRVVGSAGGSEKVAWLKSLGVDEVIDYRAVGGGQALTHALLEAAPKGIDIYFDNVGGDHLTAALEAANIHARMVICGMISQYNDEKMHSGPPNFINTIGKRLTIRGILVTDHTDMMQDFIRDMGEWIGSGKIKYQETVDEGIENAPAAFLKLFTGGNTGKMLVKLA